MSKMFIAVFFLAFFLVFIFFVGYTINTYKTCDGAVVKNTFDWPVCIEK